MPKRYYEPLEVEFGGAVVLVEPLRGLKNLQAFEKELRKFMSSFGTKLSQAEGLPDLSFDLGKQIRLGCPSITPEMVANSTAPEQVGIMQDICAANNLGALNSFFDALREMPTTVATFMTENKERVLREAASSLSFSDLELAGETSKKN